VLDTVPLDRRLPFIEVLSANSSTVLTGDDSLAADQRALTLSRFDLMVLCEPSHYIRYGEPLQTTA